MNIVKFVLIVFIFTIISCESKDNNTDEALTKPFNEEEEKELIMEVVDNETKRFFDGNYEEWTKCWSHKEYVIQGWNNDNGTADVAVGWDKINAQGKNWIEKYYKNGEVKIHPHYVRKNVQIKFFSDSLAYLNWEQLNADAEKKFYRTSHEIRIMEKETDGWKIVNVSAFWDSKPKISADSLQIIQSQ